MNSTKPRCTTCRARVALRRDGTFKRHAWAWHGWCPRSGWAPSCGFCSRPAHAPTLSPDVLVCPECARALGRRDSIRRCEAKGCVGGIVHCEEHRVSPNDEEGGCSRCGNVESFETCAACDGASVVYVAREVLP